MGNKAQELKKRIWDLIYRQNRVAEAILQLNKVLTQEPENEEALALKSHALNKLANIEKNWELTRKAIECADAALRIKPRNDLALSSKSWALIDLGKPHEALAYANAAIDINPLNAYAWYNKAWAHYLLGEKDRAIECCNRALEIEPGNRVIQQGKEMFLRGEVPPHLIKYKKQGP